MVLDFFSLREQPFGVTPDPRFWFASETHREALASLQYGIESKRGFVALIARPGMGKTTLLFNGLQRLSERSRTVFLFQQLQNAESLLQALLEDLGVAEAQGSLIQMQRKLNEVCAQQARSGKRLVVVIDEAQNLDESVLEFVRTLSNFETASEKLIQIVLSGQPQLAEKMAATEMIQLRQRISIFAYLKPLSEHETAAYVNHRLRTAGYSSRSDLFTASAISLIARQSQGIPRNINNLCFNAMSIACALRQGTIDCDVVREVIADASLERFTATAAETPQQLIPPPAVDQVANPPDPSFQVEERPSLQEVTGQLRMKSSDESPLEAIQPAIGDVIPDSEPQAAPIFAWAARRAAGKPFGASRGFASESGTESGIRGLLSLGSLYRASAAGIFFGALLCSLVVVLGNRNPEKAEASTRSIETVPTESKSTVSNTTLTPTQSPQPSETTKRVRRAQSLKRICEQEFSHCTPALLRTIREMNPGIADPNHIKAGQSIRIPETNAIAATIGQTDASSVTGRNTP